nr:acyltransferase [uncultured Prevotella sp.]
MTKEQTNILKGIAILMMLFLHLFNGSNLTDVCEPLLFIGSTPLVHIISKACNPVGIFLMLSGYGLSYTYFRGKLSFNGQEHRLLKLYIHYWIILLIFVSIGSFVRPEKYPGSLSDIIMNFTSISNSYNSETWFLFPYALLSLTSVWIFKFIDKLGCVKSIIITWILYMISCYITSRYIAVNKAYTEWYTYIITYFNVLFSFVIGAVFHRQVEKGKGSIPFLHSHKLTTFAILMTLIVINFFISSAATSYLFEFSYIFLLLHLSFNGVAKRFLMAMGKQSMVMWLTHSFFCYHIFHDFIYGFKYPLVIYIVLIVISYVVSLPISYLSKAVIQRVAFLK